MRVGIAQINTLVGDVAGNGAKVVAALTQARDALACDVVVFPELTLCGYPPEDLLLRPGFVQSCAKELEQIQQAARGIAAVVGLPVRHQGGLYNAAAWLQDGAVRATYFKQHLPNYSVFDEVRYFQAGAAPLVVELSGIRVAVSICEDIWHAGVVAQAAGAGAQLMLNLNASPYHVGKGVEREQVLRKRVAEGPLPIVYANLVGGQDELVFDGSSLVMDAQGQVMARFPAFAEHVGAADIDFTPQTSVVRPQPLSAYGSAEQSVYSALVLAVRDYVDKNRFAGVVLGLSGGVDSALTLAIAVDALGKERVDAVMMPSRYTAQMSLDDAQAQAERMGVNYRSLSIEAPFQEFLHTLAKEFKGLAPDTTEENIQARCRGVLLMAISNKFHKMVLTTGNKSEMACGYATLYGDMAGGFAPLKDVPKTLVYRLVEYRNQISEVIPRRVIERPPSAELRPDQKDSDSLPPYDVLDPILEMYIEQDQEREQIIAAGFDAAFVNRVATLVDRNEYKRRQAPPGVKIGRRAFGRDRRYPITRAGLDRR